MKNNRISIILKEVINDLINEEYSINNKLEMAVEKATIEIINKYKNNEIIDEKTLSVICGYDNVVYRIPVVTLACDVDVENLKKIHCMVNVYKVKNEDIIDKIYSELACGGNFNKYNGNVEITIYSVDDGINLQWLRNIMYHECEHAFQFEISGEILEPTNSYIKAKNIVKGTDVHHNSNTYNEIAWLVYYYNKLEMDANVNSLYGEMMTDNSIEYENTNFYVENVDIANTFNEIIDNIDEEETQNVIAYFGFTPNKFVKYIVNQKKYLVDKVKRVLWLVRNKRLSIKENVKKIPNMLKHKPLGKNYKLM